MGDVIQDHKNMIQTTGGTIASIGLEQTGKKVAGALVTPATWALNYAAEGSKPGALDVGIWLSGFVSAPAAIITGFFKAAMDDDMNRKLELIRAKEPAQSAPFIKACYYYGAAPPSINALSIARNGGTAWITSVGLWVYITDARGLLVADYQPQEFVTMCRPKKPYRALPSGGFAWETVYR